MAALLQLRNLLVLSGLKIRAPTKDLLLSDALPGVATCCKVPLVFEGTAEGTM